MRVRLRWMGGMTWLLLATAATRAENLVPLRPYPIAAPSERCEMVLPTSNIDDKYYLLIGSLSSQPGPYRVWVQTTATNDPVSLPPPPPTADPAWQKRILGQAEQQEKARKQPAGSDTFPPGKPPPQRSFHLFVRSDRFLDPGSYAVITGQLQQIGKHCQVYVDRNFPDPSALRPTIEDAIRAFDEKIFPLGDKLAPRYALGRCCDVDRDGRFTILFSPWLGRLASGTVALDAMTRGSDLHRDLRPPYSNACDMIYLNTSLKPGPYLHSLLAHEYAHLVLYTEHVLTKYLPGVRPQDEESWLNEGLAHVIEDLYAFSTGNLDYRISAFLSWPRSVRLVVPDYHASGLWRGHGNRGATFLFLRWCLEQAGPDTLTRLFRSNLAGIANLEAVTQKPFADLFRSWSLAVALGGFGANDQSFPPLVRPNLRHAYGGRLLAGPRFEDVKLGGGHYDTSLVGTGLAFVQLHSPSGVGSRVRIAADPGTGLQVSVIRLPPGTGRLTLERAAAAPGTIRLSLTTHDSAVTLEAAAWERLAPASNRPEDTSYRPGPEAARSAQAWFGTDKLGPGETRTSVPLTLPRERGPWVCKVVGRDAAKHTIAAWLVVE